MDYPKYHKEIVTSLLDGEFITIDEHKKYNSIKDKEGFYVDFFNKSFGFNLEVNLEYYFLTADKTDENTSRNIVVFFALLCSGIDKNNENVLEKLNYEKFTLAEIWHYLENSAWIDILESNQSLNSKDNIQRLINKMKKRNIISKSNDQFYFTKAHKYFIDFIKDQIKQSNH